MRSILLSHLLEFTLPIMSPRNFWNDCSPWIVWCGNVKSCQAEWAMKQHWSHCLISSSAISYGEELTLLPLPAWQKFIVQMLIQFFLLPRKFLKEIIRNQIQTSSSDWRAVIWFKWTLVTATHLLVWSSVDILRKAIGWNLSADIEFQFYSLYVIFIF